jgi:hypothetical protein
MFIPLMDESCAEARDNSAPITEQTMIDRAAALATKTSFSQEMKNADVEICAGAHSDEELRKGIVG